MIYIDRKDEFIDKMIRSCYPAFNGRKIKIDIETKIDICPFWDEGSHTDYVFFDLSSNKLIQMDGLGLSNELFKHNKYSVPYEMKPGIAVVTLEQHGNNQSIYIIIHPENAAKYLSAKKELTRNHEIVLSATRSLKNSYGGKNDCRFTESQSYTGITKNEWIQAQKELLEMGMLAKNLSITNDGRNAIGNKDLFTIGKDK